MTKEEARDYILEAFELFADEVEEEAEGFDSFLNAFDLTTDFAEYLQSDTFEELVGEVL